MSWAGARVFVTGATGLLGSHLVRLLVERGATVVALIRDEVPRSLFWDADPAWSLAKKVISVRGDVEDYFVLERTINEYEIDTIFHLAAQAIVGTAQRGPLAAFRTNIEGTWNLLEAARVHADRVKRIVVASSDKAYGSLEADAYDERFPLRGEHPYDVSKSCADLIARSYFVSYGSPVAITRCGNLYGPGDLNTSRLIPGTIASVLAGEAPVIRSDGSWIRDYLYVEDGALAYLTLAEAMARDKKHLGEAYNFSYGEKRSVKAVVDGILAAMKRADLAPRVLGTAKNEIAVQRLDSTKARQLLGWAPSFGYDAGLARTIAWHSARALT